MRILTHALMNKLLCDKQAVSAGEAVSCPDGRRDKSRVCLDKLAGRNLLKQTGKLFIDLQS